MRKWSFTTAVVVALAAAALVVPGAGAAGSCPPGSTDPSYCPAPVVVTGAAMNVTSTSATLTGTINGQGAVVGYAFLYGTTTAYGSRTPTQTLTASTATQPVNASLTGLTPGTTYHFRLFALNQANQAGSGFDVTFMTPSSQKQRPKLTLKGTPSRDRKAPFKFRFSGRLRLPTGVTKANGCKGTVTIKVKRRSTVIKRGTAKLSSGCTYRKTLRLSTSKLSKHKARLLVTGRFNGNAALLTASAHTHVTSH
jgi:Fibronectin type III domain